MKRFLSSVSVLALLAFFTLQASAKEITIRGHLEPTVESGGWLIIVNTKGKSAGYLLLNANSFRKESWFRAGAVVEATGEVKPDVMTIYQQGTPFEARSLRLVGKKRRGIRTARVSGWVVDWSTIALAAGSSRSAKRRYHAALEPTR